MALVVELGSIVFLYPGQVKTSTITCMDEDIIPKTTIQTKIKMFITVVRVDQALLQVLKRGPNNKQNQQLRTRTNCGSLSPLHLQLSVGRKGETPPQQKWFHLVLLKLSIQRTFEANNKIVLSILRTTITTT